MIPNFLSHSFPTAPAPTGNFRPVVAPRNVRLIDYEHPTHHLSPARKAGVRYEARFHSFGSKLWGSAYTSYEQQLFAFNDTLGPRAIRPDGVLRPDGTEFLVIFEVKVRHCIDSYFQLAQVYSPVLHQFAPFRGLTHILIEVCRSFDPFIAYPALIQRLDMLDLGEYCTCVQPLDQIGVLIWK